MISKFFVFETVSNWIKKIFHGSSNRTDWPTKKFPILSFNQKNEIHLSDRKMFSNNSDSSWPHFGFETIIQRSTAAKTPHFLLTRLYLNTFSYLRIELKGSYVGQIEVKTIRANLTQSWHLHHVRFMVDYKITIFAVNASWHENRLKSIKRSSKSNKIKLVS